MALSNYAAEIENWSNVCSDTNYCPAAFRAFIQTAYNKVVVPMNKIGGGLLNNLKCVLVGCDPQMYRPVAGQIKYLYRVMTESTDVPGSPSLGNNAKSLGARVPRDYSPSEDGLIYPGSNGPKSGMSTSTDPGEIQYMLERMPGTRMWRIPAESIPPSINLTVDPDVATHIMWDVLAPMPKDAINEAIQATAPAWEIPPEGE